MTTAAAAKSLAAELRQALAASGYVRPEFLEVELRQVAGLWSWYSFEVAGSKRVPSSRSSKTYRSALAAGDAARRAAAKRGFRAPKSDESETLLVFRPYNRTFSTSSSASKAAQDFDREHARRESEIRSARATAAELRALVDGLNAELDADELEVAAPAQAVQELEQTTRAPQASQVEVDAPEAELELEAASPAAQELPALVFSSGLSRPSSARPWILAGAPIGVVAGELSRRMLRDVAGYAARGGSVFVDSGAFTAATKGRALDFEAVLATYWSLAILAGESGRSNLYVVAPDRIGDQAGTLELLAAHSAAIRALARLGVRVLVPFQKGELRGERLLEATEIALGGEAGRVPEYVAAFAYNLHAWTADEVEEFVAETGIDRLHLLGGGREKVAAVQARFDRYEVEVQGDATRLLALSFHGRKGDRLARLTLDGVPTDVRLRDYDEASPEFGTREEWLELVRDVLEEALWRLAIEENGGPNDLTRAPWTAAELEACAA